MRREWILIKKTEKIEIPNKWSQFTWHRGQVKMSGTMEREVPFLWNKKSLFYYWLRVGYFIVFYEDLKPITVINWSWFVATWSWYHIKQIPNLCNYFNESEPWHWLTRWCFLGHIVRWWLALIYAHWYLLCKSCWQLSNHYVRPIIIEYDKYY